MSAPSIEQAHAYLLARGWRLDPLTDLSIRVYTRDDMLDDEGEPILLHLPTTAGDDDANFLEKLVRLLSLIEGRPESAVLDEMSRRNVSARPPARNPRAERRSLGFRWP